MTRSSKSRGAGGVEVGVGGRGWGGGGISGGGGGSTSGLNVKFIKRNSGVTQLSGIHTSRSFILKTLILPEYGSLSEK